MWEWNLIHQRERESLSPEKVCLSQRARVRETERERERESLYRQRKCLSHRAGQERERERAVYFVQIFNFASKIQYAVAVACEWTRKHLYWYMQMQVYPRHNWQSMSSAQPLYPKPLPITSMGLNEILDKKTMIPFASISKTESRSSYQSNNKMPHVLTATVYARCLFNPPIPPPPRTATTEARPSYAGFTQTSWLPVVYKRAAFLCETAQKKHDKVGILTLCDNKNAVIRNC